MVRPLSRNRDLYTAKMAKATLEMESEKEEDEDDGDEGMPPYVAVYRI